MTIYPAIDIQDGKCVMLRQGRADDRTIYSDDPVEIALKWEKTGAEYVHIVDLDGAIYGEDRGNLTIIKEIRKALDIPIQVGGGIRDGEKVSYLLEGLGIDRIIVGTMAVEDTRALLDMTTRYPGQIAVSIDAEDGLVAIKGWTEGSNVGAIELCNRISDMGIDTVIYTDILKDGMLQGPNIGFSKRLIAETGLDVIVSGGVSSLNDIKSIAAIDAAGAIVGRGLYSEQIQLQEAIGVAGGISYNG